MVNHKSRKENNKRTSEQVHSQKIRIVFDKDAIMTLKAMDDKELLNGLTIGTINETEIKWHTKPKSLPKLILGLSQN